MSDKSDTPRTDALQEELAGADGPECLYTEEMADRMWLLMRDLEGTLTRLYANVTGDSMALGIMQLQRDEIRALKRDLASANAEVARLKADNAAPRELQLTAQSREAEEARFYRYLRDEAGQLPDDHDGPMICAGLGDNFDYLRGEECDIAIRAAIDAARSKP